MRKYNLPVISRSISQFARKRECVVNILTVDL